MDFRLWQKQNNLIQPILSKTGRRELKKQNWLKAVNDQLKEWNYPPIGDAEYQVYQTQHPKMAALTIFSDFLKSKHTI